MDELHRRLADRIRARARERRIVLTHLPDLAGVGQSQFWNVLAGRKSPTLRWIGRVAAALEIDAGTLLAPATNDKRRSADPALPRASPARR